MGFSPYLRSSDSTSIVREAEPQLYCLATSGYGQETGKFSPTNLGKLSPTVTIRQISETKPFYGYRKVALELKGRMPVLTEKQVRRIMQTLQIKALHAKRNTSVKHPENPIYPYLLKDKEIRYPNQVWSTDLTYIKLPEAGYVYLTAILDVYSRKVLSWRVSNSMDVRFCEEALQEAIARYGAPAIFNTD